MVIVSAIMLLGAAFLGHDMIPADPLTALQAVGGLWLLGLGYGLIASAACELVPEMTRVFTFIMMPLYMASGVILPIVSIPHPYQGWLLLNPIVHGLESARVGFAPYYHTVPGVDLGYLYLFAVVLIFLGLALHVRFANRLVMQ